MDPETMHPVPAATVARTYVHDELSRFIPAVTADDIADLDDTHLWRMLQALSVTVRHNGVFATLTNQRYDWFETEAPAEAFVLGAVREPITRLIFSEKIGRSAVRFADYLHDYFAAHPADDPEDLAEFRPRPVPQPHGSILTCQQGDRLKVIDGNHRLVAQLMAGRTTIAAYVGITNGKPDKHDYSRDFFETLATQHDLAVSDEERRAVLTVARMAVAHAADGTPSLRTTWSRPHHSDATRAALRELAFTLEKNAKMR